MSFINAEEAMDIASDSKIAKTKAEIKDMTNLINDKIICASKDGKDHLDCTFEGHSLGIFEKYIIPKLKEEGYVVEQTFKPYSPSGLGQFVIHFDKNYKISFWNKYIYGYEIK